MQNIVWYSMQSFVVPLELCIGHRGVLIQGTEWTVSTPAPYPTLRYCEGGMEGMVSLVEMERMEWGVTRGSQGQQDQQVPLALAGVEWSTQGGGKLAVQMSQELSWCTQGGLVEPGIMLMEEQPTTSACLMIQTTATIILEFKVKTMFTGQSMNLLKGHYLQLIITTFPALFVMLPREKQWWWSQLKPTVHRHGLWNTLVILCQDMQIIIIIQPCMSVLTRTLTQYQGVLPVLRVPCSTTLKLTAMEWLVHLTTHRKNSPVQFVPNKEYTAKIICTC